MSVLCMKRYVLFLLVKFETETFKIYIPVFLGTRVSFYNL